jgi:hypothetical protein
MGSKSVIMKDLIRKILKEELDSEWDWAKDKISLFTVLEDAVKDTNFTIEEHDYNYDDGNVGRIIVIHHKKYPHGNKGEILVTDQDNVEDLLRWLKGDIEHCIMYKCGITKDLKILLNNIKNNVGRLDGSYEKSPT